MGQRLGQHFLKHGWAARALAHAANPDFAETIVEIGPGKGILTKELLTFGNPVVAIEKDEALVTLLNETFAEEIADGSLKILGGDIRDVVISLEPEKTMPDARHHKSTSIFLNAEVKKNWSRGESGAGDVYGHTASATLRLRNNADGIVLSGGYIVAANIPYYITGEIIRQFLTAEEKPRAMALLVQKEVAQRITDTKSSILSLSVRAFGVPSIIKKVPKSHFSPPPSVDSAILLIDDISKDFFTDLSEAAFFQVVHAGFSSKRKFLANNLGNLFAKQQVRDAFETCGIDEKARAEDLSIDEWQSLARELTK